MTCRLDLDISAGPTEDTSSVFQHWAMTDRSAVKQTNKMIIENGAHI